MTIETHTERNERMHLKKFVTTCTLGLFIATAMVTPSEVDSASSLNIVINNITYNNQGQPAPQNINDM